MKDGAISPCAFPTPVCREDGTMAGCVHGMSLRDYFAAFALQGMLESGFQPNFVRQCCNTCDFDYTVAAYAIADKMLKARET